jgi:putative transposase
MSQQTSPNTQQRYGLKRVCDVWKIPRSTVYENRRRSAAQEPKRQPGPEPMLSDDEVVALIREDLKGSPFHGEGHRKVHARLRRKEGVKVGRDRIRKVMRNHNLLSPYRSPKGEEKTHDGRITTDEPGVMWGTDAAKILTSEDGWVWFFGVIEHWNAECMGWHLTKRGDRFAALEPVKMALQQQYGSVDRGVGRGLALRSDHGSQYRSEHFVNQVQYWGITPSFGFVKEPETNGVIERFNRTLKEQVVHGRVYKTMEDLRVAVGAFLDDYNEKWLIEKLGYRSPREARRAYEGKLHVA